MEVHQQLQIHVAPKLKSENVVAFSSFNILLIGMPFPALATWLKMNVPNNKRDIRLWVEQLKKNFGVTEVTFPDSFYDLLIEFRKKAYEF